MPLPSPRPKLLTSPYNSIEFTVSEWGLVGMWHSDSLVCPSVGAWSGRRPCPPLICCVPHPHHRPHPHAPWLNFLGATLGPWCTFSGRGQAPDLGVSPDNCTQWRWMKGLPPFLDTWDKTRTFQISCCAPFYVFLNVFAHCRPAWSDPGAEPNLDLIQQIWMGKNQLQRNLVWIDMKNWVTFWWWG